MPGRCHASIGLLLTLVACTQPPVTFSAPDQIVLGESPGVFVQGLEPGVEYTISAELADAFERVWAAESRVVADRFGEIDLSTSSGASSTDALALLHRMRMPRPPSDDWEPPPPNDFNQIMWSVALDGITLASADTRQWITPPGMTGERLLGDVAAEFFRPAQAGTRSGVLLLGGSGGGMDWARRTAALLAAQGHAALAVAYFNFEDLPEHLVELPVEYVEAALDSLIARPEVDPARVAIVGYSKGAELALLVASRRPDVGSVVAFAPGSAVFQGFRPPDYPVVSSWSARGEGLPFVPNAYDERFFETFDGMYLWYRTLAEHEAFDAAAIPVENIGGDILLISGVDDQIWPATFMGEQIVARLGVNESEREVRHLAFPEAGHGIAAPPGEPLSSVAERLGGTALGNGRARQEGWQAVLEFLAREPYL